MLSPLEWGNAMRLGIFVGVAALVLITLLSAFPQVVTSADQGSNTTEHLEFTREITETATKLDALQKQHEAMATQFSTVPEKIARIEERLDLLGRMVWAILGGIFALLAKEIWGAMKIIRSRRTNGNGGEG